MDKKHPLYDQDPNMKIWSQLEAFKLQELSEDPGLNVHLIVKGVTQLLCYFLCCRPCLVQGVPYGVPALNERGDTNHTIASIFEEITLYSRERMGSTPHNVWSISLE
jgi:hypothetical protein